MPYLAQALPIGTRIAGYEITGCLGAGGFGITYRAFNKVTDRQVAIKEFFPQEIASRSGASTELLVFDGKEETLRWALEKFETTTTYLCRLSHPNIVKVLDYYPGNRTGYMVMEFLRGKTLEDWLRERDRPPRASDLAPLLEPVLDALEYLHSRGLIHRDISPDNIFIREDNRPVLIDFGGASQDRSVPGSAAGPTVIIKKRSFTAPDQARELALPNPTADVYSFGAVLYQALSGTPPADGEERMIGVLQAEDPYRSLEMAPLEGISRKMGHAVDRCLLLDPSRRPQSIEEARCLFDWRDNFDRADMDREAIGDADQQEFSLQRDVIESVVFEKLDLLVPLSREPAPPTPASKTGKTFKSPRIFLLFVLLASVVAAVIWVGLRLRPS